MAELNGTNTRAYAAGMSGPSNTRVPLVRDRGYTGDVYSGSVCVATAVLPNGTPIELGSIQLLSVSTHRDTIRVLPIGYRNPKGYAFGPNIVAGSLSFTVIDRDAMDAFFQYYWAKLGGMGSMTSATAIPPFDIVIGLNKGDPNIVSEHGFVLQKVSIVDSGIVLGITKPVVGQEYAFVCKRSVAIVPNTDMRDPSVLNDTYKSPTWDMSTTTISPKSRVRG